jgi:peptidyl-prolyl cis-trans isomerase SurA
MRLRVSSIRGIRDIGRSGLMAVAIAAAPFLAAGAFAHSQSPAADASHAPVVLDSVIAIINGEVVLQSDLQEEIKMATLQPLSLPEGTGGRGPEVRAAQRLINRALILQQVKEQGMGEHITDQELQENLAALRKQLPACIPYHCETDAGWSRFLADHNLTLAEVDAWWRQRMEILRFIDARFRAGVRIPNAEISDYYNKTFVPEFKKQNAHPPELAAVSNRIQEILLQQHVNALLQDWLKSLRDQGSVQILDPRFDNGGNKSDDGDGE